MNYRIVRSRMYFIIHVLIVSIAIIVHPNNDNIGICKS